MSLRTTVTPDDALLNLGRHVQYRNPITREIETTGVITGVDRGMVLVRYRGGPPELTHCENLTYIKGETE